MNRLPVKDFKCFLVNKIKQSLNILHDKVAFAFNFSCPEPGFIEVLHHHESTDVAPAVDASSSSFFDVKTNNEKKRKSEHNSQQQQQQLQHVHNPTLNNKQSGKKCSLCEYLPVAAVKCLDCNSFYCGKCALMLNFLWDSLLNTKESYKKICASYSANNLFGHEFLCVVCKELHVGKIITNLTESEASFNLFNRKVYCNKFGCDVKDDYSVVSAHYGTCSSEPGFKIEPERSTLKEETDHHHHSKKEDTLWPPTKDRQKGNAPKVNVRIHGLTRQRNWQRKPTYFKHRKHWQMHRNKRRFFYHDDLFPSEMFED